jgi:hypothetical protein
MASAGSSFTAIIGFVGCTILYYLALKPKVDVASFDSPTGFGGYSKKKGIALGIYFFLVVLIQYIINVTIISSKCGTSSSSSMQTAFLLTFIPWIFIFGVVILVLMIFPGFKSAFSNVIGYFVVAGRANKLLTELLVNTDLDSQIDSETSDPKKNAELKNAAQAIIKICGNTGILINQISLDNFQEYWNMLKPLMKPQFQAPGADADLKERLIKLTSLRDNVGEGLWYLYTAILIISISQYSIASSPCKKDVATMKASQEQYLADQAKITAENEKASSTIYTY